MAQYSKQWIALSREAAISGQSISAGLTAIRKANYAANGLYSHAFFSLSIGIERLLKLIFILYYAESNAGRFPSEDILKKQLGHDLQKLYTYALSVHERLPDKQRRYELAENGIECSIIKFLSDFAKSTRYYNLNYLSGGAGVASARDPITQWFGDIGGAIIERHYSQRQQQKDMQSAALIEELVGGFAFVRHTAEDGTPLDSMMSASLQTGKNKIVQKYGTLYCARIARFLYMLLYDLTHRAHRGGMEIPFLCEFFFPFMNSDKYLLSIKTFPPRGQ